MTNPATSSGKSDGHPLEKIKQGVQKSRHGRWGLSLAPMALSTTLVLVFISATISTTAGADEFGSYCIDKNGVERCFIWQWNSKKQTLIKKQITRSSQK